MQLKRTKKQQKAAYEAKAEIIMRLSKEGKSPAEIAKETGINLSTVYNMRLDLKKKKLIFYGAPLPKAKVPDVSPNQVKDFGVDAVQIGGDHYKQHSIQPWDVIHDWKLGFFTGNVVKYISRYRSKSGMEDLKKARHYLDKLIALNERGA